MAGRNRIREKNMDWIKQLFFQRESAFKTELVEETQISMVTINSIVNELVEEGVLMEAERVQKQMGRPAVRYAFNYDAEEYLLVSVQEKAGNLKKDRLELIIKIVNMKGKERLTETVDFPSIQLADFLDVLTHYRQKSASLAAIGISFPGKVHEGTVVSSWNDQFNGWNIEKEWNQKDNLLIHIQNDAHMLTAGYSLKHKLMALPSLVGIYYPERSMPGISIFIDGYLYEGSNSLAGEAKYLPMFRENKTPETMRELAVNLGELTAVYNAVLSPSAIIVSSDHLEKEQVQEAIETHPVFRQQPNQPKIFYEEQFQEAIFMGLRWLVHQPTTYPLS